jgi:hypothetical protein
VKLNYIDQSSASEADSFQLVKKFTAPSTDDLLPYSQDPATYPCTKPFHVMSLRSILILSSQLRLCLQTGHCQVTRATRPALIIVNRIIFAEE